MGVFGRKAQPVAAAPPPRSRGCCAGVSRAVCQAILTILFICIAGLSIAALVGRQHYWAYYTVNSSDPGAYNVRTGWLDFSTRDQGRTSLRDADFGTWVIGIIAAAVLLLSAVLAIFQFFLSITNNCGRHTAGLAFPMGIILLGILIAYICAIVIRMRDYTANTTGTAYTLWPSWGWIVAIIASGLWFIVGICASSMALKAPPAGKLPQYQEPAGAYPAGGAYAAGGAPPKGRRGWFGRNKAAPAAAGTAAGAAPGSQAYTAQPFNAPTAGQRDVELGQQPGSGVRHNGHGAEAAALGGGAGLATAAAGRHHNNQYPNQTPYAAQDQRTAAGPLGSGASAQAQPKRRGWFGRKSAAEPADVPTAAAGGPMGGAQQPSAPAMPAGDNGGTGGGAWAGSRLAQNEGDRLQMSEPETMGGTGPARGAGPARGSVGGAPGSTEPAGFPNSGKGGTFSFYH